MKLSKEISIRLLQYTHVVRVVSKFTFYKELRIIPHEGVHIITNVIIHNYEYTTRTTRTRPVVVFQNLYFSNSPREGDAGGWRATCW